MNAWNFEASDERLDALNVDVKTWLLRLQTVWAYTYQRKSVAEIARLLGCTLPTVRRMQRLCLAGRRGVRLDR
jgi:hypothetical protein